MPGPPVAYFMNYAIYFTDRVSFDAAVASYGSTITTAPSNAALLLGLPFPVPGGPLGVKGMYYFFPFLPGNDLRFPLPSGILCDPTVDTTLVPGQPDALGNIYPDGIFTWLGIFTLLGGGSVGVLPPSTVPIPVRRWAVGFELPGGGETDNNLISDVSREASRTVDGFGFAMRGLTSAFSLPINLFSPGFTASKSWERFYIRLRTPPSSNTQIWNCHGSPQDSSGGRIEVTASGELQLFNVATTVPTLMATTAPLTPMVWYRCDVLIKYNDQAAGVCVSGCGTLGLYLNGSLAASFAVLEIQGGLAIPHSSHVRSSIGNESGVNNGLELDLDDWISAGVPSLSGVVDLRSLDWLTGSHVQQLHATGLAASSSVNWVGDYRVALENPAFASVGRFTSSTTGARLAVTTDAAAGPVTQFGAASMTVGFYGGVGGGISVSGTLGYSLAGGAAALSPITQAFFGGQRWNSVLYTQVGLQPIQPPPYPPNVPTLPSIFPVELIHEKGASAAAATAGMLSATVEYIGAWGPEDGTIDLASVPPVVPGTDIHNAPYTRYELTGRVVSPQRSVVVVAGTYSGNSSGQDVNLPFPAHWYWQRRLGGSSGGPNHWHSTVLGAGLHNTERVVPDILVRALMMDTGQSLFQVSGPDPEANLLGETYQFVAVCDPGMRYTLAGAFGHSSAVVSATNPLFDPTFTPDSAFLLRQQIGLFSNAVNYWYKGAGYAAASAQRIDTPAALANQLTFGVGSLVSQGQFHSASPQNGAVSYVVCRLDDGTGGVVYQILSYIGTGGGRTITLTPTSGRWPLFAMVMDLDTGGVGMVFRDPSHTGITSSTAGGTITNNGITGGGVDQITVAAQFNQLGITYSVFVIPGGPSWSNGVYIPVPPTSGPSPVFPGTPGPPPPPPPIGCHDDWGTPRPDGLPYIPLSPP